MRALALILSHRGLTTLLPLIGLLTCATPSEEKHEPDIDMYFGDWRDSQPRRSHGSLVERDILTRGSAMNPSRKAAVLERVNSYSYALLPPQASTTPTSLEGQQEIFFFLTGNGTMTAGGETSNIYRGITILMPAGLEFVINNPGEEPLTMFLVNEPIPDGFRSNEQMLVHDENTLPVTTRTSHWCHIVKTLFTTADGLGTLEAILTVTFDPLTIGEPHSHGPGTEEVWTAMTGTSLAFIGTQLREHPPGVAYMVPPDKHTTHSNINHSKEQVKMFYFAFYRDHELRK